MTQTSDRNKQFDSNQNNSQTLYENTILKSKIPEKIKAETAKYVK